MILAIRKSSHPLHTCFSRMHRPIVVTVKNAGSYSSKPTLSQKPNPKNTAAVSQPNLYAFLNHLQNTTADQMSDVSRLRNGLNIHRPKSKANIINESRVKSCLAKFDNESYSRLNSCVPLVIPLVPCRHARFCESCANCVVRSVIV